MKAQGCPYHRFLLSHFHISFNLKLMLNTKEQKLVKLIMKYPVCPVKNNYTLSTEMSSYRSRLIKPSGPIKLQKPSIRYETMKETVISVPADGQVDQYLGLYSLNARTSYRRISSILEAAGFRFRLFSIALKFDRHLGSSAAQMPVRLQSDTISITTNLAVSLLHEICQGDVLPLSE